MPARGGRREPAPSPRCAACTRATGKRRGARRGTRSRRRPSRRAFATRSRARCCWWSDRMLLAALLLLAAPATVHMTESGPAKVGGAAPSFAGWDLRGERVLTLDGLRRTPFVAPLLITFGASWCKPCAEGLARFKALLRKNPDVRLVLIDVESERERAQQLAAKSGIDGPAILDKFEVIAKAYGVSGAERTQLPRTFLVDTAGKIRAIYGVEGEDLEKVVTADLELARVALEPAADGK